MKKQQLFLMLLIAGFLVSGCRLGSLLAKESEILSPNSNRSNSVPVSNSNDNSYQIPSESERIYQVMEDKANELGRIATTVKLDPNAKIKGKVAVVAKKYEFSSDYEIEGFNAFKTDFGSKYELERFNLSKERMAVKPDEIETLVNITCNQGKAIGRYVSPTGGKSVPAYSMICKVAIIDYPAKTVIAQKTLENRTLEKTVSVADDDTKYVNLAPWEEITDYLRSFQIA